jgi:hypothetical protein
MISIRERSLMPNFGMDAGVPTKNGARQRTQKPPQSLVLQRPLETIMSMLFQRPISEVATNTARRLGPEAAMRKDLHDEAVLREFFAQWPSPKIPPNAITEQAGIVIRARQWTGEA